MLDVAMKVARPVAGVVGIFLAVCMYMKPKELVERGRLYASATKYYLLNKDRKFKLPGDVLDDKTWSDEAAAGRVRSVKLIFIRHGESTWNETFNKGDRTLGQFALQFVPGLLFALATEAWLMFKGFRDSWFFDSPLSKKGIRQSAGLAKFLERPAEPASEAVKVLQGKADKSSIIVSSNLRRSISTVLVGLSARLRRGDGEAVLLLPSLQEMSRNPDTLSITPALKQPVCSWVDKRVATPPIAEMYARNVDATRNTGSKSLKSNGLARIMEFADWAVSSEFDYVVAGGHSLYFRTVFRAFMPARAEHKAKAKKIVNGGAVVCTLKQATVRGVTSYRIDPESVEVVHGGF